jgi:hypothetical protein
VKTERLHHLAPNVFAALALIGFFSTPLHAQQFAKIQPLSFTKSFGGLNPLPQILTVASTGTSFNFSVTSVTTSSGGSWLSVDNPSFGGCGLCATPENLRAIVNPGVALAAGTYTGQIVITSQSGTVSMTVPVTLTIAAAGAAFLDVLPGGMSFSLKTGGLNPPSQPVQIRNGGTGALAWTLTTTTADGGSWLSTSAANGTAPSIENISLLKQNLPGQGFTAGTFIGQLVFKGGSGSVTIPVSVVVGDNVFNQVNAINFTKPFGGANPNPQTLTAASTGTPFNFTVSVSTSTGGNWLSVDNVSFGGCVLCSTPQAITAIVNASPTLAVGTYTAQIIFT